MEYASFGNDDVSGVEFYGDRFRCARVERFRFTEPLVGCEAERAVSVRTDGYPDVGYPNQRSRLLFRHFRPERRLNVDVLGECHRFAYLRIGRFGDRIG